MKTNIAWGSHLPVLIKVIHLTQGDVLELGMGLYSTPFLHWACFKKRKLVSYDNNLKYFNSNKRFENDLHEVHVIEDWDDAKIEKHWDVALIDHAPAERRIEEIKRLANFVDYLIIHDSQGRQDKEYHYSQIYHLFKYMYTYKKTRPFTTILSNFIDITNFEV